MNARVVMSAELGNKCWSSMRFLNQCHKCLRYNACTYPERTATVEYDELMAKARYHKAESDRLYALSKEV